SIGRRSRRATRFPYTTLFRSGASREGDRLPVPVGPQGYKVTAIQEKGSFPQAVPLAVMRIGDVLIATVPGEPTVGAGKLLRDARSEEHTSELQSLRHLVCRLL